MRNEYDVIVVGARVAGASTAMLLARQGHQVLLLDRATMPSDALSTHAILRTGVLQLTRWGLIDRIVASGAPPIRQTTLGFGADRIHFDIRDDFGIESLYAPRRFVLDDILVQAAAEAGVHFVAGAGVNGLLWDRDGAVNGVIAGHGDNTTTHHARMVIGADGVHSRIARRVNSRIQHHHPPRNTIHYAYYTGIETPGFWFQFTPGVNAGVIPTNNGEACVFVGRPVDRLEAFRSDPEGEFHRLLHKAGSDLAETVAEGSRTSGFRGTPGLAGFLRQTSGPGWALVGDAGYTKDPISAHGISDALRDAELCARAVGGSLRNPEQASQHLSEYQRIRDVLSLPMYRESKTLAGYGWSPEEASTRMRRISQMVRDECDLLVSLHGWSDVGSAVVV
ncbi:MAG: NAD(P)/FAD-dependent oxidoreductase [Actinobacteria bacterium]|nr:NAD(P)/FAD-dependent oxidoreductase [Actinomycetota bacterium]MCI0677990.1 NAD(P)/FAD-dependent oxidoreductase [Actinomycetota bacterium]